VQMGVCGDWWWLGLGVLGSMVGGCVGWVGVGRIVGVVGVKGGGVFVGRCVVVVGESGGVVGVGERGGVEGVSCSIPCTKVRYISPACLYVGCFVRE